MTMPLLSLGFRPFFLAAGAWAALAMALWLGALAGLPLLPSWLDSLSWHAHEMTFGYLFAALAGFLLTATPSWTNQPPLRGARLACLAVLWVAGRGAMLAVGAVPLLVVALADLAMPLALFVITAQQVVAANNWRNLSVLGALGLLVIGDILFHLEGGVVDGAGLRLGLAGALTLISIVGGRIVPNFTRNWLKRHGRAAIPAEPDWLSVAMNGGLLVALLSWVWRPDGWFVGVALIAAGIAHAWRLARWGGLNTGGEPLVWVLHLAYLFLPVGAVALGIALLGETSPGDALHLWTVGAVGLMTLAVMTRATLAHSGGALTVGSGATALYLAVAFAAVARPLSGLAADPLPLQTLAALAWIAGFVGFVVLYGPRHLGPAIVASPTKP